MKITKNKFFSLSLMWEGIKQTKTLGICFTILTLVISCFIPMTRILRNSGSYDFLSSENTFSVNLLGFAAPVFLPFYIIPIILVFALFGFMNKRNASDIYHSVPLNRTCIYITYTAVVLLWCVFTITLTTLLSFILYTLAPNSNITSGFLPCTFASSLILAVLVTAITLVAKGLSGTGFSNIVITLLIMFVPRVIIMFFANSVCSSIPIAEVEAIPLADIYNNIVFAPFGNFGSTIINPTTLWYSLILAIVYLVLAFFLHKVRKSETAETSSSFKAVQHIVRTMLGIVPTLFICFSFACRKEPDLTASVATVIISLLLYFLYELATTRSGKKLLYSIPLYLIVVGFNFIFVFGSYGVSDIILNDIPETSDISSVTVLKKNQTYYYDDIPNYTYYKLEESKLNDPDLIKLLRDSLVDNVSDIKSGKFIKNDHEIHYEAYNVTFHCKNGKELQRTVFCNSGDFGNGAPEVEELMQKDSSYVEAITALPTDNEIKGMSFYRDELWQYNLTNEERKEIWSIFISEYAALSYDDKISLNSTNYYYDTDKNYMSFIMEISGYIGTKDFCSYYEVRSDKTPKTLSKLLEIFEQKQNNKDSGRINKILSSINLDNEFSICLSNIKNDVDNISINYSNCDNNPYLDIYAQDEINYDNKADKSDIDNIKKITKIITDATQTKCDTSKEYVFFAQFYIYGEEYVEFRHGDEYWSEPKSEKYIINLTAEQYKEINDIINNIVNN